MNLVIKEWLILKSSGLKTRGNRYFRGNSIFGGAPIMGGWTEEIKVRGFDFLDVEPKEERCNYDNEFVVIPCRLKVKVQSMLSGAGDAATRTIDVCNQFGYANSWTRIENIGGQQP